MAASTPATTTSIPSIGWAIFTEHSIAEMVFSRRQMDFGFAKRDTLPGYCRACKYLFACWGECPKNRCIRTPEGDAGLNYLCGGLRRFFEHADPHLRRIAQQLQRAIRRARRST